MTAELSFDGASRGNPGPAAYGFVLRVEGTEIEGAETIGTARNNEAEYAALQAGLETALAHDVQRISIQGDSQLIVRQIRGEYDVNAPNLQPMYTEVSAMLEEFDEWSTSHVDRDKNTQADELANVALDEEA